MPGPSNENFKRISKDCKSDNGIVGLVTKRTGIGNLHLYLWNYKEPAWRYGKRRKWETTKRSSTNYLY